MNPRVFGKTALASVIMALACPSTAFAGIHAGMLYLRCEIDSFDLNNIDMNCPRDKVQLRLPRGFFKRDYQPEPGRKLEIPMSPDDLPRYRKTGKMPRLADG